MPDQTAKILVAPLDWGLGHATRMMIVVDELIKSGIEVHLGGTGPSLELLQQAFPDLPRHSLPSYSLTYQKNGDQGWTIIRQLPRLLRTIRREKELFKELVSKESFHGVISDNRYGLFGENVESVIVCHQIAPIPPKGWNWLRPLVTRIHARYLSRFGACWIPDLDGSQSLAGTLSDPKRLRIPHSRIGMLSRFSSGAEVPASSASEEPDDSPFRKILAVLSGPEPHRGLLENLIMEQAAHYEGAVTIVRGFVDHPVERIPDNVTVLSHASSDTLLQLFADSDIVISRPGYSSLMDYHTVGCRNVVLVPTPGQSEQAYLAQRLEEKAIALVMEQHNFSLAEAARLATDFFGFSLISSEENPLQPVIEKWLTGLKTNN